MSPSRSSFRRNSSSGFKPYTRGVTPILVAADSSPPPSEVKWSSPNERPGFPTYAQYKQVETAYLQSLTPRRQGKALISQALFDRIWDVLHQPESQGETAQFRFWARKMFTISKTHRVTLGVVDDKDETPSEVLLHDNLLVAIQEQLYDLLCYCHGSTGHGGRDKTCALIRKHYTWVPKDLVSNFIKACPTCIMKKCGNLDSVNLANQVNNDVKPLEETTLPAIRDFFQNMYPATGAIPAPFPGEPVPWPTMGDQRDTPMSPSAMLADDPLEAAYREALVRARGARVNLGNIGGPSNMRLPNTFSMSREVSLYKGLPNGWQFRHPDYETAYAEFMRTKDLPVVEEAPSILKRPRVPSILPLWGPDQYPHPEMESPEDDAESLEVSPRAVQAPGAVPRPETMQYLLLSSESTKNNLQEYVPQIDPALMHYSHSQPQEPQPQHGAATHSPPIATASSLGSTHTTAPDVPPALLRRAAAPLRLNLEFPSEKTFQALFTYRESLGDGNLTPDSPLMAWHPGNPSPASSDASASTSSSRLSAFPLRGSSTSSNATTPASSALPTPVDECVGGEGASDMAKGKQRVVKLEHREEEELSGGIEAICGLHTA